MASFSSRLLRHVYLAWPGVAGGAVAARDALRLARDWARAGGSASRAGLVGEAACKRCGISARVPGVWLGGDGRCADCHARPEPALEIRDQLAAPITLERIAEPAVRAALTPRATATGVDALVALSGGKDSLVTLTSAVALGMRVAALTLDNGFLLAPAREASVRWCERLGIALVVHPAPMQASVAQALASQRLAPWPCVVCFDHLSRALLGEAERLGASTILTGLRYRWPGGRSMAPASEAFAAYAPPRSAAHVAVVNLPAALDLDEREERALLAAHGWVDPGIAGHSTNCLLPAHFEHLHRERTGRPHDSVRFVALEARLGVIPRALAIERMAGAKPDAEHTAELERRLGARIPS